MGSENSTYAVITGASSGIGMAIAKEIAFRKHNLVLHSLPDQGLPGFCAELESLNKIHALSYEGDLTSENGPENLFEFVKNNSLRVNILVNNAGIGFEGPIESYSKKQIDNMILLNIRAVTLLTSFFTPELKTHSESYIMNISSFGAYLPTAYKSVYLASKSYLYFFTRALESELAGSAPNTCVVVPASVRTNKIVLDRIKRNGWFSRKLALSPEEVAAIVVTGMFKGRKVIIPGKLSTLFFRVGLFVPEGILMWLTRRILANNKQENQS
jgi:uncharacterized protein